MSSQSLSLTDILRQDQQERWRRGERILVESYIGRHPELMSDTPALLDLIESEISLREELGESPRPEEYLVRFASLRAPLSALLSRCLGIANPSANTDGDAIGTRQIKCPFCTTDLRGPLFDVQGQCDHCGREIKLLDETVSLTFRTGRTIGSFELLRRVGRGTFGEVWLARDTVLHRDVAIKVPRGAEQEQQAVDRFLREARAAAQLRHPNLVSVYETGCVDGVPYIASAFIAGTNLQDLIHRRKLSLEESAKLMQTIAAAVAHAHAAGILHRDLKPANVLVDASGIPHVADFGLAKNLFSADATLTIDGQIVGTPAYMAPEQTRPACNITAASDVYALGVMLYESITHQRPFTGELESVFHQIRSEEPLAPRKINPAIPADLETICLKAMSKMPEDRYASAQELADDLGRFLKGELIQGRRPSLARRIGRRLRAVSPALLMVAVICVLAGLGLGLSGRPNGPEQNSPPPDNGPLPAFVVVGQPEPPSDAWQYDVLINTDPPGAKVVLYQLDFDTLRPQFNERHEPEGLTPLRIRLSSAQYLVVAFNGDDEFQEAVRSVPRRPEQAWGPYAHENWTWKAETETVEWKPLKLFPKELPDEELVWSQGAEVFTLEAPTATGDAQRWKIPPFGLQATEVTAHRARGRSKSFNDAQPADHPAVQMSWDEAMVWAEANGMRLPDLVEAEFLATFSKEPKDDPLRMSADWKRPVKDDKADVLQTVPPLFGISSGALEWTQTRSQVLPPGDRTFGQRYIVRGGPMAALKEPILNHAGRWASVNQHMEGANFSVRCARSPGPRLKAEDFLQQLP